MSLRATALDFWWRSNLLIVKGDCFGPRKHAKQERLRNDIVSFVDNVFISNVT